jgi:hypothetical protein
VWSHKVFWFVALDDRDLISFVALGYDINFGGREGEGKSLRRLILGPGIIITHTHTHNQNTQIKRATATNKRHHTITIIGRRRGHTYSYYCLYLDCPTVYKLQSGRTYGNLKQKQHHVLHHFGNGIILLPRSLPTITGKNIRQRNSMERSFDVLVQPL